MKTYGTDDKCIVTLSDSNYYPGLESLYCSIQETFPVPLICFDIGLTEQQKATISQQFPLLQVMDLPDTDDVRLVMDSFHTMDPVSKPGKRVWPLWLCPFLIASCPYSRVIWMDCDLLVLRKLDTLFEMLEDGPVFTPENLAPERTPNKAALYELLPIAREFDHLVPCINAGVSGWHTMRDRHILEAYCYPIIRACHDISIRDAISWHDQGALIWAIQKTAQEFRVLDNCTYNLCVKHTPLLSSPWVWSRNIAQQFRLMVADANIIHWNGHQVPWSQ